MVRKTLIAGNWKMNCLTQEGTQLAKEIAAKVKAEKFDCEFLICARNKNRLRSARRALCRKGSAHRRYKPADVN